MVSHKDILLAIVGIVLVVSAFAGLNNAASTSSASGLSLRSSYDSINLYSSRTANVFFYVSNAASEAKTVSFSADSASGFVETFFDYYDSTLAGRGSRGATLRLTAPGTMTGCDLVTVNARVCSSSGCETLSKTLRVFVSPSKESSYYITSPTNYCANYYEEGVARGSRVQSRLDFAGYFDPTEYDANFIDSFGVRQCKKISPGEYARFQVSLRNLGAATSYDVRLIGDKDVLNAEVSSDYVSLERNEIAELTISVSPSSYAPAGRYHAVVQAQRRGVTVSEQDLCIEVEQSYGVRLSAPSEFVASTCGISSFKAVVENTGTGRDVFAIDVSEPDWALVATRNVDARAGQKQQFEVKIDGTRLQPGVYRLGLKATSGENYGSREVSDKAFVSVRVEPCTPATSKTPSSAQVNPDVQKQVQDELVKLTINIENPGDSPIDNASVVLLGLPENWTYSAESGFTIPARSSKALTILIKRTTDDEASGVILQIKSGDAIVGVQDVPKIESRASGLTGFFVAAGGNTWIIALIIVVALAVVVLSGRLQTSREAKQENNYENKLRSLKAKLEAEASEPGCGKKAA